MNKKTDNIYLIDGNALCYRGYYAIRELSTSAGVPTNAIYGFVNMLRKLINNYEPEFMTVVFDTPGPTTRHEKYEKYKDNREPMPDDLAGQMDKIKEVVEAFNIPIRELSGYEADDIIATLALKACDKGLNVTIVTSDKDAMQLVDKKIKVLSPATGGEKLYDSDKVVEKFGVKPENIVDLLALMGDASDNIPGVKGVGKKTAEKLVSGYGSIDEIYNNIDKVTPESLRKRLVDGEEMARFCRDLIVLEKDVSVDLDLKEARLRAPDTEHLTELYKEFEFNKLLREITPVENEDGKYFLESSKKGFAAVADSIKKAKIVALYAAVPEGEKEPRGIALSWKEGESCYVPFEVGKGKRSPASDLLIGLLEDKNVKKIGHDLKNVIHALLRRGIKFQGIYFDVMIADYLLDPSRSEYDLAGMAMRHLGIDITSEPGSANDGADAQKTMGFNDSDMFDTSCRGSDTILRLYEYLRSEMKDRSVYSLFEDVEMPLINVLASLEEEGVSIDIRCLKKIQVQMSDMLEELTKKIYLLAGEEFNINSPKQLQDILFVKMKLPTGKRTKTGFSTDESVLSKLAGDHELPAELLEYRSINKLKTGYCDSILDQVDKKTHIIYAKFNQAVTATGRLSSSEPNLQNIPVKTDLGREIRRVFVPGDKDSLLLSADYSQVELRVLAHLSGDKTLVKAFKEDEDIHTLTASLIFDIPEKDVTDKMRSNAKTVNFGIIYGMSPFRLAGDLGIRMDEAKCFIDSYFERYPGVMKFINMTIDNARKSGFVTTLLNRRRYIPEMNSKNERLKGFAERIAVNTPVQGSAADIIKLAMIRADSVFKGTDVKMLIQVHDELVFKVPAKILDRTARKVKDIMENAIELKVPLKVDIKSGKNWLEMKENA